MNKSRALKRFIFDRSESWYFSGIYISGFLGGILGAKNGAKDINYDFENLGSYIEITLQSAAGTLIGVAAGAFWPIALPIAAGSYCTIKYDIQRKKR